MRGLAGPAVLGFSVNVEESSRAIKRPILPCKPLHTLKSNVDNACLSLGFSQKTRARAAGLTPPLLLLTCQAPDSALSQQRRGPRRVAWSLCTGATPSLSKPPEPAVDGRVQCSAGLNFQIRPSSRKQPSTSTRPVTTCRQAAAGPARTPAKSHGKATTRASFHPEAEAKARHQPHPPSRTGFPKPCPQRHPVSTPRAPVARRVDFVVVRLFQRLRSSASFRRIVRLHREPDPYCTSDCAGQCHDVPLS